MAQKVLVLGDSGTGKSASLRNFKPEEILVINSAGKPLPFKNKFECVTPRYENLTQDVLKAMDQTDKKVIVIDDAQYIMSFQYMRRIKENGWDKWNDIQGDFFNIIKACDYMPDDVVVYFLSHIQRDDEGHEKIKTMGKMLDEKITIEGLFTTVLKTSVKDGQYYFITQNSGLDTVKSPIGMFPSYAIDNDLKYVDDKIRNYYELGEYKNDEEIEKMDEEVKAEEVVKPDSDGKRRRRKADELADEAKETRRRKQRTDEEINQMMNDGDFKSLADSAPEESAVADMSKEEIIEAIVDGELERKVEVVEKPKRRRRRTLDVNDQSETY